MKKTFEVACYKIYQAIPSLQVISEQVSWIDLFYVLCADGPWLPIML